MNVVSLLLDRARRHPDRPALVETSRGRDTAVTFGELAARVAGGSGRLRALGLAPGDTLWLMQPVSIRLYELMLAAFHAGMRVMLADPRNGPAFLRHCRECVRPAAFFGPPAAHLLRLGSPALRALRLPVLTGGWLPCVRRWRPVPGDAPPAPVSAAEPALLTFTSGSTGLPKCAVRTHGLLIAQYRALRDPLELDDGGVDLITMPVFVLANLAAGLTSVLAATDLRHPGSPRAAAVGAQCRRLGVTRATASPAFFEGLLAADPALPAFRKIFTGGAPVFPDFIRRFAAAAPGTAIHVVYGSTEAEPICHARPAAADGCCGTTARGGGLAAGTPTPGSEVRIIRQAWGAAIGPLDPAALEAMTLPPGMAGEIVVAGDHVLPGYLNGTGDLETKIRVDRKTYHRTGDAGWRDANGGVWLLGRCAERLPAPARHTPPPGLPADVASHPLAVEAALRERFPAARTAALLWEDKRLLVIAAHTGAADTDALRRAAAEWHIDETLVLPDIPMDRRHNAKIDYPALRAMIRRARNTGTAPVPQAQGAAEHVRRRP